MENISGNVNELMRVTPIISNKIRIKAGITIMAR